MELELPSSLEQMKLDDTNICRWCDLVESYLTAIGLEHHLTEEAPAGDERKTKVWKMEEFQIINWMKRAVEPDMAIIISDFTPQKSCKEIWDDVRLMYSKDRTKLYKLWLKYNRLKQGSMNITEYTSISNGPYYELVRALSINNDVKHMMKVKEMLFTFTFLQGLRPEFEPEVYQILREAELPPCYEIVHRLSVLKPYLSRHKGQDLHHKGSNRQCRPYGRKKLTRN